MRIGPDRPTPRAFDESPRALGTARRGIGLALTRDGGAEMRGRQRGVTLVELAVALAATAILIGGAAPSVGAALEGYRATGATADLYAAVHLTKARARASGVTHALLIEPDGRGFRIVADPGGDARTVEGPHRLVDEAVATSNVTIQFSPKGFAVPAGTITIRSGEESRRIVVNLLGRARVAAGAGPA
jgi:prepilin-type N-terminal cleavage/methylation domain-containing protein